MQIYVVSRVSIRDHEHAWRLQRSATGFHLLGLTSDPVEFGLASGQF